MGIQNPTKGEAAASAAADIILTIPARLKTLVGIRMKRCGSRWHNDTGNHVMHLRALALSDRWDEAMDKLSATQRTAVRTKAA